MSGTPLSSFFKTCAYLLSRRIRFPGDEVGKVFAGEGGQRFEVFRYLVIDPGPDRPAAPGAVFVPYFRVVGMSPRANVLFSWLPIPFYVGLPGFRSKRWMIDRAGGGFAGYYEWDSVADAERYAGSFAARFMRARAVPGTVAFHVYPAAEAPPPPA